MLYTCKFYANVAGVMVNSPTCQLTDTKSQITNETTHTLWRQMQTFMYYYIIFITAVFLYCL